MEPTAILVLICIAAGLFSAVMVPYIRKRKDIEAFKWRFGFLAGIIFIISIGYAQQLAKFYTSSAGDNIILLAIGAFMYGWGSKTVIVELGKIFKAILKYFDIKIE
jgi:hypothetical protein